MSTTAVGEVLPAAVAVALSPIPIIAIVLVLGTPRARANGPMFALGWLIGLSAASAVVVVLFGGADDLDEGSSTVAGVVRIALGLLLIALAAKKWWTRPGRGDDSEMPSWMATLDTVTAPRALGLGLALAGANPKNLVLIAAAAASISDAGLDAADTAIALAAFVVIGSVTVIGSVAAFLVDATRAARPLAAVKQFMLDHNDAIMSIIFVLLGAKVLGAGLADLGR